jgi:hypothetical protein
MERKTEISMSSYVLEAEDNLRDIQEDHRAGDHEANSRDFQQVTKNDGLDIVEGSALYKTEKETAHGVSARKCWSTGHSR